MRLEKSLFVQSPIRNLRHDKTGFAVHQVLNRFDVCIASNTQLPKILLTPRDELRAFEQFIERHNVNAAVLAPE